jgi:two-component system, NtrC family, sensor kinase
MKIKFDKTRLVYALAAAGLVTVLGVLFMKTRAVDFDTHNEILGTMRELKQVDAEWNVDVLRAKTGLSSNYDRVASPLPLIASLDEALSSKSSRFWQDRAESADRLKPLLDKYRDLMNEKVSAIERFKSQNSILRNSSRFLPVAATDLVEATRASAAAPALKSDIERTLNNLLADAMTYSLTPDAPLRERIDVSAQQLAQLTAPLADDVRERAQTLSAHVATVLKQQDSGAKLLAQLGALPTAKAIDELSDAQAKEHEALLTGQQIYRQALFGYAAALLALLAFVGWRLYGNYKLLNRTNDVLHKTNLELKESQVHLVQSEKMSALGQMVAGIAHEINTPLAYVKGTFSVLDEQLSPVQTLATHVDRFLQGMRAPVRDTAALNAQLRDVESTARSVMDNGLLAETAQLLKDGIHGIEQISEIVLNLKNFSRLDRAKVAEFSVEAGLNSTLLLANNLLKNKVEVRKEFGAVPTVTGSPSQINQVFLNIISNAVHAMPERAEPNVITLRTAQDDSGMVRIEIQDNGSGIPRDVLPKIFDPFFTTKPIGQGTGMGLSISFKIIQEHGGKILVDSEPGVGTVFTILLPIKAAPAASAIIHGDELIAA